MFSDCINTLCGWADAKTASVIRRWPPERIAGAALSCAFKAVVFVHQSPLAGTSHDPNIGEPINVTARDSEGIGRLAFSALNKSTDNLAKWMPKPLRKQSNRLFSLIALKWSVRIIRHQRCKRHIFKRRAMIKGIRFPETYLALSDRYHDMAEFNLYSNFYQQPVA